MAIPSMTVAKTEPLTTVKPRPNARYLPSHTSAIASSTIGYLTEIGLPQPRHFPRSRIQLRSGIFSKADIGLPQFGQRERGEITESSSGQREMQTLRNDPKHAPITKL